ncbi:MAG: hypothetical protein CMD01_04220 [Flavobacteriales bacterium]|nr:hypothetical protein [Flavobacteriales bacterium]
MKRFYYWLTYGNFWIAFGAAGLTFSNLLLIYNQVDYSAILLSFLVTLGGYNFQRIRRAKELSSSSNKDNWLFENRKKLSYLLICSLVLSFLLLLSIDFQKLMCFIPLLAIVLLYRWPVLGISLRDVPGIKIFLIAISWGLVTVLIPDLFCGNIFTPSWKYVFTSTLYVLAITIPFDIRDYSVDDSSKKTIPQLIGLQKATILAVLILLALTATFCFYFHYTMMGLYCLLTSFVVSFSFKIRPDWYYSFILDGLLVLMPLTFIFQ